MKKKKEVLNSTLWHNKYTKIDHQNQWNDSVKIDLKYVGVNSKLMGFQSWHVKQLYDTFCHWKYFA